MEINPRVVFERLFGRPGTRGAARRRACSANRSILDLGRERGQRDLQRGLGARDRARLDEYLDNVREIERRIQRTEARRQRRGRRRSTRRSACRSRSTSTSALMFDLLAVAYQADLTRVFTFMMARELSQRTYPEIGVTEPHHTRLAPRQRSGRRSRRHAKINTYHAPLFAEVPREAAGDARRRRLAARSLADLLRRRHEQRQPARQRSAAAARRAAAASGRATGTSARRRGRRSATSGCRVANDFGSPIDTLRREQRTGGAVHVERRRTVNR